MDPLDDGGATAPLPVDDAGTDHDETVKAAESEARVEVEAPPDAEGADSLRSAKVDRWLSIATWTAVLALIGLGGFFGYSVWAQNRIERASSPAYAVIDAAKAAVDKTPNDSMLRVQLGQAYGAAGMYDEARAELDTAIRIKNDNVDAYQALAMIEMLRKNYDQSESALKKILDLTMTGDAAQYATVNQRREIAYYYLGEISLLRKQYEIAVNYFKAAIRVRRDASDSYVRLAQAYIGMDLPEQAIKQLKIALQFDPRFPEAHFELGKLLLDKGQRANAAWEFRQAIDNAPEQREPQAALAAMGTYEQWYKAAKDADDAGRLTEAIEAIDIARAMDPKSYDAAMLDGRLLERKPDLAAAVEAYKAALEARPGDKAAQEALTRAEKAVKAAAAKGTK
jgi:tetratricopeptide (TPR) repeat protein